MSFTSIDYAALLLVVFLACRAIEGIPTRNAILLAASYIFYGWWDWRFLSLIILSSSIDYLVALAIDGKFPRQPAWLTRRSALFISVAANLSILGIFKYLNFFLDSTVTALAALNITIEPIYISITLPIGISFYTFQSMSYSIDVYRRQHSAEKNIINFFLYVSFFPQLVAGPIERAGNLLAQIKTPRTINYYAIRGGIELIAFGLFKKLVIADNLARVVDHAFGRSDVGALALILGVYAFAFQIYCDFSGYTDIARGSARLLGFNLRLNFDMPYFSASPREFWRRWHMSLSSWIRDYIYIPLGGRSSSHMRTALTLALTMGLCGLWHGAAWTYIIWGIYHGFLLICSPRESVPPGRRTAQTPFFVTWDTRRVVGIFITFNLIAIGWLVFRAENFAHLQALISKAFFLPISTGLNSFNISLFLMLVFPLITFEFYLSRTKRRDLRRYSDVARWSIAAFLFYVSLVGQPANLEPFIYFQF